MRAKTYLWYSSTCYVVDDEICSDRLMFVTDFFSSSVTKGFFLFSSVNISIEIKFLFYVNGVRLLVVDQILLQI